ncbi:hypothetical protein, partial [Rothia endophytica]|uniref:hypothetical protein n=1 Tax=Rothia endophytica TaxID=1324766 RepID=UPI001F3CA08A
QSLEDARVHYTVFKQQPTHTSSKTITVSPTNAPGIPSRPTRKLVASKPNNTPKNSYETLHQKNHQGFSNLNQYSTHEQTTCPTL